VPGQVYSERILYQEQPEAWKYYTVPEGKRAIIRNVQITRTGSVPTGGQCHVKAHGLLIMLALFQAGQYTDARDMRVVVYGGETVGVWCESLGITAVVSGYIFEDPTGANQPPAGASQYPEWAPPDLVERPST